MRHVSSIHMVWLLGGLSLAAVSVTGCLRDIGLGPSGSGVTEIGGAGGAFGESATGVGGGGGSRSTTATATAATGTGSSGFGVGGSGMTSATSSGFGVGSSGVGGSGMIGSSSGTTTSSSGGMIGSSSGATTSSGGMIGSSSGTTSSSGGMIGSSSGTTSSSGGSAPGCTLGQQPVSCDFANLNADCAPYGAVCDYVFGQCSCCFVHDQLTCTTDADCEAAFGANVFCSAGICGCK